MATPSAEACSLPGDVGPGRPDGAGEATGGETGGESANACCWKHWR